VAEVARQLRKIRQHGHSPADTGHEQPQRAPLQGAAGAGRLCSLIEGSYTTLSFRGVVASRHWRGLAFGFWPKLLHNEMSHAWNASHRRCSGSMLLYKAQAVTCRRRSSARRATACAPRQSSQQRPAHSRWVLILLQQGASNANGRLKDLSAHGSILTPAWLGRILGTANLAVCHVQIQPAPAAFEVVAGYKLKTRKVGVSWLDSYCKGSQTSSRAAGQSSPALGWDGSS